MMHALILAAGYGTRLYPVTLNTSKALVDICGTTILDETADKLAGAGIENIYVLSNEKFKNDLTAWADQRGGSIKVVSDGSTSPESMLGAIGDLDFFLRTTRFDEDLFIFGSDNLFSWQLDAFVAFARKTAKPVVGVYDMKDKAEVAGKFGVVETDAVGKVVSFEEKPDAPRTALIGTCMYYVPKAYFAKIGEYLAAGSNKDAIGRLFAWFSQHGELYAFPFSGTWLDIGHLDTLEEARTLFAKGVFS
jgi:glucose-1-phosphate thymidylyltransferase